MPVGPRVVAQPLAVGPVPGEVKASSPLPLQEQQPPQQQQSSPQHQREGQQQHQQHEHQDEEVHASMPAEAKQEVTASLRSRVLELALDSEGSRKVQTALECARGSEQELLVRELQGHVSKALQSPHGNHVLQKAIAVMWPADLFFIVPELLQWGRPSALARHPYGCRILERLIEFFPAMWLGGFIGDLLEHLAELSRHQYGNFVVQHLLEHGDLSMRGKILAVVNRDLVALAGNPHGCAVIDKALAYASVQDQMLLIQRMLEHPGMLSSTAVKRWGFATAERLLSVAQGHQLEEARRQLLADVRKLQRSASGRILLETFFEDELQHLPAEPEAASSAAPSPVAEGASPRTATSKASSSTSARTGGSRFGMRSPSFGSDNGDMGGELGTAAESETSGPGGPNVLILD